MELFRGVEGLERLTPSWNALCDSMERPRFFHRPEWYRCYLETLVEDPTEVVFCAVPEGNALRAVLPFKQSRRKMLGMSIQTLELTKYDVPLHDFVVARRDQAPRILERALEQMRNEPSLSWDQIRLTHLLEDSAAWAAIRDLPGALRSPASHCDEIVCKPYDQLLAGLSKNFRGNLRKARNKLGRNECVEWITAETPEQVGQAFDEFLEVEASGWKSGGEAVKLSDRKTAFYRRVLRAYTRDRKAEVALLRADGKTLAAQLSLIEGTTLYLLKIGYDESKRQLAPGNLLLEHLLERLADRGGIQRVNLISGAPWHKDWKAERLRTFHGFLPGPTWKGKMMHAAMKARRSLSGSEGG